MADENFKNGITQISHSRVLKILLSKSVLLSHDRSLDLAARGIIPCCLSSALKMLLLVFTYVMLCCKQYVILYE